MITRRSNLQELMKEMPTIRPSVRTYNILGREGVHTVGALIDIAPWEVQGWRNANADTLADVETLQTCVHKILGSRRVDPVHMISETHGAFAIRVVQWETWWAAHDSICPHSQGCHLHTNPHQEP